jgi:putative membrane protein
VTVRDLPTLNALLNTLSALFVLAGVYFIRRKEVARHRAMMLAALAASALFLTSYLYYHYQVGSVRYQGTGAIRTFYLGLLLSHTVLAAAIVPMVLRTVYLALRNRIDAHRRLARWTFPIWIYVSVTGVIVYLMLYQF